MTLIPEMTLTEVPKSVLADGLRHIQRDVDSAFDNFLPVPPDSRARLVEAMRSSCERLAIP